ncbi:hypothetical protein TNCV_133541 [Trichonephila clavipes]|nr:hypothetical protein TNCV_133541 [Trichonephila clavipes]
MGHLYRCVPVVFLLQKSFLKIELFRRRGRPFTQWLDGVDHKLMRINRWKVVVTDRVNWRRISDSALACRRLLNLRAIFCQPATTTVHTYSNQLY